MRAGKSLLACTVLAELFLSPVAFAAEWEKGAGIAVGGYYTDNVCLAPRGQEDKWVGNVRPDVSVQGKGARGNVSLIAAADYNSLGDSDLDCEDGRGGALSNRESFIPSARLRSDYELFPDWLELRADANARRNAIDPFAPGAESGFEDRDNTNITYDYTVGALLQRRLAQVAELRLRYDYNEQFNRSGALGDSSEDRAQFDLETIPGTRRLSLGVGGRYSKVSFDAADGRPAFDNELSSAELRAALQLSRSWELNGLAGEEWNEFTSVNEDIDGGYWDAGLRWTPNARIEVSLGYGERFFGATPRADVSYRHKRSTLSASYARTLTFPRDLRIGDSGFLEPEDPIDFGDVPDFVGLPTFIGSSPLLNERLDLRYRFDARRTAVSLFASESRQRRVEDDSEGTFRSMGITLSRTLSSVLSASLRLNWSEREGQGDSVSVFGTASETWRAGLGISRRIGRDTSFSVAYDYTTQDSDFERNNYDENRVTFSVRHGF